MAKIFTNYDDFVNSFKDFNNRKRLEALKRYLARGGVISAKQIGSRIILSYPDPQRVIKQIDELKKRKEIYEKQYADWKKKKDSAQFYDIKNKILKYSDPVYWKHLAKYFSDKDYKQDVDNVKLPVHLVADERWKPMIKMFVEDPEYRANLVETFNNSIVYKKDKKLAKYADQIKSFRIDISNKVLEDLEQKILDLQKDIDALNEIFNWSKEK
ncbi:MAG: hypothetical protein N3D73_02405 [Candidatus Diapherotrites archaeon]|nr:hypothetical protein [Candidatus Diapherotrites archaeon]